MLDLTYGFLLRYFTPISRIQNVIHLFTDLLTLFGMNDTIALLLLIVASSSCQPLPCAPPQQKGDLAEHLRLERQQLMPKSKIVCSIKPSFIAGQQVQANA
jgi:hypothetical protein